MFNFKRKKPSAIQKVLFKGVTVALMAGGMTNAFSAIPSVTATLIKTTDTSAFDPSSPDPSGITYLKSTKMLLICDGEVNEIPDLFTGDNLFEMSLDGVLKATSTTVKTETSGFSNEPTGVSRVNPVNDHIFFTDDDDHLIFEIAYGNDEIYGTGDDTIIASIDTKKFPTVQNPDPSTDDDIPDDALLLANDPEGIAYAPELGDLFVADGTTHHIYRVSPGINGIFDGVSPSGDDVVTHFNLFNDGLTDPEGIEYDSTTGHLLIIGEPVDTLFEVTTSGDLVQTIDISGAVDASNTAFKPAGLALAPSTENANESNIYIANRGVDNDKNPTENDGEIFEMSFVVASPTNDAPIVNVGKKLTITFPAPASLKSRVTDDQRPNAASLTWSKVDGPGDVSFANANEANTDASFSAVGTYTLKLSADDTEHSSSKELTVEVKPAGTLESFETRVSASSDDAENKSSGIMDIDSKDLDIAGPTVGVRFNLINIPFEASIKSAYIQFKAEESNENSQGAPSIITGEATDNALTFIDTDNDITDRVKSSASVDWDIVAWTAGDEGLAQRTPDITDIIQETVDRDGWISGNSLALMLSPGAGGNSAVSYDEEPADAPKLVVEFVIGKNEAPTVDAGADQTVVLANTNFTLSGVVNDDNRPLPAEVTVKWEQVSGEGGVTFSDDTALNTVASFSATGTYTLKITADDGELTSSDEIVITVIADKIAQAITDFTATPDTGVKVGGNATLNAIGSEGSGNAVTFASSTDDICTVDGSTVTIIAVGDGICKVTADQLGNSLYSAAQETLEIATAKADQALSGFKANPVATSVDNSTLLSVATKGDSTSPVVFSSQTTTICTVDNATATVRFIAKGSCILAANQAKDPNYNAALEVTLSISVSEGKQVLSGFIFESTPEKIGDTTTITMAQSGVSGLPVVFASKTPDICTITEGNKLTIITRGSCQLSADQAGNDNYKPATTLLETIVIESGFVPGDSTGTDGVNIQDIVATINRVLATEPPINGADCDLNNLLDIRDIVCTINIVLSQP